MPGFLHVCPAAATDGLILGEQAERKEQPPNTSACWKHLFSKQQLFAFPAYWMSGSGYLSFAECIINRWTFRSSLILGKWRNVDSIVDTHTHTHIHTTASEQLLLLLNKCMCVYVSIFITWTVCFCVSVFWERDTRPACVGQLCGRRIPLWPFPGFIDSYRVIWLPVKAPLSTLYILCRVATEWHCVRCPGEFQDKGLFNQFKSNEWCNTIVGLSYVFPTQVKSCALIDL